MPIDDPRPPIQGREFEPFGVSFELKQTIASLPKRLRARLGGGQGDHPKRGETRVGVLNTDTDLAHELITRYARVNPPLGKRDHFTLIASFRVPLHVPSWVEVQHVHQGNDQPFAVFMQQLRNDLLSCVQRDIFTYEQLDPLFVDGTRRAIRARELAEERAKAQLWERSIAAVAKLRQLTDAQIAAIAADNVYDVEALERIVTVPNKFAEGPKR